MRIVLFTQYYPPESIGPAVWIRDLVEEINKFGHELIILTTFPNHPHGKIFAEYRRRIFSKEQVDGITIIRTWLYPTASKAFWSRVISFLSFTFSSLLGGLLAVRRADAIYTVLQPMTLGIVSMILGFKYRAKVIVNLQDIHPDAVIDLGIVQNPIVIKLLKLLERWIYRNTDHLVVISEGFRENLLGKGVPDHKISVVPNWVNIDFITPGPADNAFRESLNVGSNFLIMYSGGLTHNSNLEPVIAAADALRDEPFRFVIVGEGVHGPTLKAAAVDKQLQNVSFLPFQPLEQYPDVLRSATMNLVTLHSQASHSSVPSKIYKQMAAGRAILAIAADGTELSRLIQNSDCGLRVDPDDPAGLVAALRWAATHPEAITQMGLNARHYVEQYHSSAGCVAQLESVIRNVVTPLDVRE